LLDEADRPAGPVVDRGVEHERLHPRRQQIEARRLVVMATIDLGGHVGREDAHVVGAGRAPEVARQGGLGDAELGRPAAIPGVVHVATLAPDHVVDHLLDGSGHGRTCAMGLLSYNTDRRRMKPPLRRRAECAGVSRPRRRGSWTAGSRGARWRGASVGTLPGPSDGRPWTWACPRTRPNGSAP